MSSTAIRSRTPSVLYALAVTPLLRWLVAHHSVTPDQPWRTRCDCGQRLWPAACRPAGSCPGCSARIGPRPYQLEAVTLLAAAALIRSGDTGWQLAAYTWWTAGMIVLVFVDLAVLRLPHRLTTTTTLGFLTLLAATGDMRAWTRAVTAGAVLAGLFAILAIASRGQLGWGDVALAVPVAAALGWHSWTAAYAGTLLGLGAAALAALVMRHAGKLAAGEHLPLGPFLIAGTATVLLWT